ncbi:hypothetical protein GCM10022403_046980 [Streptomyces coacervatus]|uniref:Uncharacterized protein n=1 Tax=Streptomyces coacervatus TaxID=647381 RepID=A0ABP7I614_9ACTN|nr:hypothetical protein [Streptomyces coacervatus]MDF2266439.1 hypothetical protein [Streptomyces coacervatus]
MPTELSLIAVAGDDQDSDIVPTQIEGLRSDLLELSVARVGPRTAGPAPEGTRADVVEIMGALAVVLEPTIPLLVQVVTVVRDWLGRTSRGTAVLEINGHRLEVTGVDSAEQRRLANAWLAAVTRDRP